MSEVGDVVLVSGVTGALGLAVGRLVLARGGRVAATVRRAWQVEKVRQELGGERVLVGVVGAEDGEAAAGFVKGATDALGAITALIGAAGMLRAGAAGREPAGDLRELLEANLLLNATLARAVLPSMRRRGAGALAFVGAPENGSWSATTLASKAAVASFAGGVRQDLAATGIRVFVVAAPASDAAVSAVALRLLDERS
jgi:NADP-dependent 3-hydroxy acid dehydrogenase YdfG